MFVFEARQQGLKRIINVHRLIICLQASYCNRWVMKTVYDIYCICISQHISVLCSYTYEAKHRIITNDGAQYA